MFLNDVVVLRLPTTTAKKCGYSKQEPIVPVTVKTQHKLRSHSRVQSHHDDNKEHLRIELRVPGLPGQDPASSLPMYQRAHSLRDVSKEGETLPRVPQKVSGQRTNTLPRNRENYQNAGAFLSPCLHRMLHVKAEVE